MSVSGTMRRRITPRAWACSAAPSRSRTGGPATRGSRRTAGARARTTSPSRSAGGDGWLIAPPNLTASAEPDLHVRPAVGARPGCVVAHIPQRYADPAVARIHRRRKEPRELRDGTALRGDEGRAHRGEIGRA